MPSPHGVGTVMHVFHLPERQKVFQWAQLPAVLCCYLRIGGEIAILISMVPVMSRIISLLLQVHR